MDEAQTLFLSLPLAAQTRLRAIADPKDPRSLRKLVRAVYPYVQTLADAQNIADYLEDGASGGLDVHGQEVPHNAAPFQCILTPSGIPELLRLEVRTK